MNARFLSMFRVGLTATALTLCGAMALTTGPGCSSSSDNGGAGGGGGGGGSTGGGSGNPDCTPDDNTLCFVQGSAKGALKGAAWVALGVLDTITDPTCSGAAITKDSPCNSATTWNSDSKLCMTGTIPALPAKAVQKDYDDNWGEAIGVNTDEPPPAKGGAPLGKSHKTITFYIEGKPATGIRAKIHVTGDDDQTSYCATFNPGDKVTLTAFNTHCWNTNESGAKFLADTDVPNIDSLGIQVSATGSEIKVDNLCLDKVEFGDN